MKVETNTSGVKNTKDLAIMVDLEWCTGCYSCEVACNQIKTLPEGTTGIKVTKSVYTIKGKKVIDYIPIPSDVCNLCEERIPGGLKAACELSCPADVIRVGPVSELMMSAKAKSVLWFPKATGKT